VAKELKSLIVDEMTQRYQGLDRCVVLNFRGLSAQATVEIRRRLREHQIDLKVVKNSLMARALKNVGLENLVGLLEGPCAVATGGRDVVELAKVLSELSGKGDRIVIRGGYGEGQVLASADVKRFTLIPARPVLIAHLLSVMQAPVRNFVGTLGTFTRSFVTALDAVAKKRGESE